jgi:hypothetical protein
MAHLLNCECGRQLTVSAGEAGTTVPCVCGRAVAVPSFSHLRGLPEAAAPAALRGPDGWFVWLSLTVGVALLLIACAASLLGAVLGPLLLGWSWVSLAGCVLGFFYSAGMCVVFTRVRR